MSLVTSKSDTNPSTEIVWPVVRRLSNGRLMIEFDTHSAHVSWLKVRDWLSDAWGARFRSAHEYPTFDWIATLEVTRDAMPIRMELRWSDYPDELTLNSVEPDGDVLILEIAAALSKEAPDLGRLKTMRRRRWRRWMISLGSTSSRAWK